MELRILGGSYAAVSDYSCLLKRTLIVMSAHVSCYEGMQ